jgi:serine/threonine-protein kinase
MLGRGGMADVWLGIDERLGRPVAVKVLDRANQSDRSTAVRFNLEARTVARLAHPNIVAVYDVGTDNDAPYLVMELVEGPSVAQLLQDGPLDIGTAIGIAGQICDALEAAHEAGVVHRDVKPANVLVTAAGRVKVCDFGIARPALAAQVGVTGAAIAVGTSEYMAPEQVTGGPLDHRADLYGLGCLLYAMLTGHPPFSGDTPMRVVWQHLHQVPTRAAAVRPGIPADLDALVGGLLAKDPADRPGTAAEVRRRLASLSSPPATAARTSQHPVRAHAALPSPTHALPTLDVANEPPHRESRLRLGPAGIAAVAVGVAVVTALVVAMLAAGRPAPSAAQPSSTPSSAAPSRTPSAPPLTQPPADPLTATRAAIQNELDAGQLDRDAARDLNSRLDDVARRIAEGDGEEAAGKLADLRRRLGDLRNRGKITEAGYEAVLARLNQLAATLPATRRGKD